MDNEKKVYVVPTGTANLWSVMSAFRHFCTSVELTKDPSIIKNAGYVVIPGVGSFGKSMEIFEDCSIKNAIMHRFEKNLPTFLICVGLQICASSSEESPGHEGLGIFGTGAVVIKFPGNVRCPQQGWNLVHIPEDSVYGTGENEVYAYYSNSYALAMAPDGWVCYKSLHGIEFVAALERGSWLACQFHPELSDRWGLELIKNWIYKSPSRIGIFQRPSPTKPLLGSYPDVTGLTHRIIPCLDVKNEKVIKGVNFENLKEIALPEDLIEKYQDTGADEIAILDISATLESRKFCVELIKKIRTNLHLPLTVGGGIKDLEDAKVVLESGADKISINSAAVKNPQLINLLSAHFGRQCIVLAIDALLVQNSVPPKWHVSIFSGKINTRKDVVEWSKEGVERGAGEILLTSIDRDGTRTGYDLELLKAVSSAVNVPIIASGGAASVEHFRDGLMAGADAVLAASVFHFGELIPIDLKRKLNLDHHVKFPSRSPC